MREYRKSFECEPTQRAWREYLIVKLKELKVLENVNYKMPKLQQKLLRFSDAGIHLYAKVSLDRNRLVVDFGEREEYINILSLI
jgi:hypothetical protein